jgi:hypothetical protein
MVVLSATVVTQTATGRGQGCAAVRPNDCDCGCCLAAAKARPVQVRFNCTSHCFQVEIPSGEEFLRTWAISRSKSLTPQLAPIHRRRVRAWFAHACQHAASPTAKHQPECAVLPDRTWQPTTPLSQYATPCVANLRIVADGLPPNKAHSQRRQLGKGCGYEHDGPQQRIGQRCARRAAPALPPQEGGCGGWATFQCGPDAVGRCGDYRSCFLPDRPASRRQSGAHGAQW